MAYLNDRGPFGDAVVTGSGSGASAPADSGNTLTGVVQGITQGLASVFGAKPQAPIVVGQPSSGIDTTTLLLVGGLGLGAFLILRKKK